MNHYHVCSPSRQSDFMQTCEAFHTVSLLGKRDSLCHRPPEERISATTVGTGDLAVIVSSACMRLPRRHSRGEAGGGAVGAVPAQRAPPDGHAALRRPHHRALSRRASSAAAAGHFPPPRPAAAAADEGVPVSVPVLPQTVCKLGEELCSKGVIPGVVCVFACVLQTVSKLGRRAM